ncbi:MAG: secretin N-terminal domain-containing protein [Legionella sp.]|nr:secretin N-terminal domain-containing protein [Legionella sp.]
MKKSLVILWIFSVVACTTNQPLKGTAIDSMTVDLHQSIENNKKVAGGYGPRNTSDISNALMPDIKFRSPQRNGALYRRFDVAVKDVPASTFYMGLVKDTSVSMVVSPEIKGDITLNLKHVTVEQVLQALEDTYHYTYNRIPGGFEILPHVLQTRIYAVNYLELQRTGNSNMRLHSGEVTESVSGSSGGGGAQAALGASDTPPSGSAATSVQGNIGNVNTSSTVDFWKRLESTLKNMIGEEGTHNVTVNPLAGVVVVRAYPQELKQVESYLDLVQNSVDRQVILEAKILEVTLDDEYQMGINWNAHGLTLDSIHDFPGTGLSLTDFPDAYTAIIKWGTNFVTTIRALETQGNVQILSSPRVSTMNNQQSLIKVGNDEFFVSGISRGQASGLAVAQPTDIITPFFSGLTLDVTPQINVHGDVTLHVHPSVSLVTEQIKEIHSGGVGTTATPLAKSAIRESDTIVHAKNGQVIVIGGLMQNQTVEEIAELPVFGHVPFLGTLVRRTKQTSKKSELVILIKPTVVTKAAMQDDLINTTQRTASLKQGFHIGGRPDIFGSEGEEPIMLGPKAGAYDGHHRKRCRKGDRSCQLQQQQAMRKPSNMKE